MSHVGDALPSLYTATPNGEADNIKDVKNDDPAITMRGLLITVRNHEEEINEAWEKVRDEKMPLSDAALITMLAIKSVVALELEFKELFHVEIRTVIRESYQKLCADAGVELSGFVIDFNLFSIAEEHYILQFWMLGKLWGKTIDGIKSGRNNAPQWARDETESKLLDVPSASSTDADVLQGIENANSICPMLEHDYIQPCQFSEAMENKSSERFCIRRWIL